MAWVQQEEKMTYQKLFSDSPLRGNIIRWYPIQRGQRVLLISEKCEALENTLREMGADVTFAAMNPCMDTADIGAYAYDVVFHVGVIDAGEQLPLRAWQERIEQYRMFLKENGTLLLAVCNRMGLKYFAGCQDDNYAAYFVGPEGYPSEMTRQALSRCEYEQILDATGFYEREFYYPYPDYLFASAIYSDARLPEAGELTETIRNFDKDRYLLFDEAKVFDSLRKEGLFSHFSNSFFIVCNPKKSDEHIIYSKFSTERDEKYRIRTDIVQKPDGTRAVRKYPLTQVAEAHIYQMWENFIKLEEMAADTYVRFCPVTRIQEGERPAVEFPWLEGEALQKRLKRLLDSGKKEEAEQLVCTYIQVIETLPMQNIADIDLIFPNIFIEGNIWYVIDYEWTFKKMIPAKWIIYRGLFYLSVELPGYPLTQITNLLKLAGITEEEAQAFAKWEEKFQAYLTGDTIPISHMVDLFGNAVIPFGGNRSAEACEAERLMNLEEKNARKLFYHLEQVEIRDGRALLGGWACARTRKKIYLPVHITIFDEEGNPIGRAAERLERLDVAKVLKADTDFAYWGFSASWSLQKNKNYILRLSAGKCQQEIQLEEFSVR